MHCILDGKSIAMEATVLAPLLCSSDALLENSLPDLFFLQQE
jgi:hypothetical protein